MEIRTHLLIDTARRLAYQKHARQFRRNQITPYISHVRDVATRVSIRYSRDPYLVSIAWLHDIIEDTGTSIQDLINIGFPSRITQAVSLLTRDKGVSYDDYMEKLLLNPDAVSVKIEDHISNLADDPTWGQIRKYSKSLSKLVDAINVSTTSNSDGTPSE